MTETEEADDTPHETPQETETKRGPNFTNYELRALHLTEQKSRRATTFFTDSDLREYHERVKAFARDSLSKLDGHKSQKAARERELHTVRLSLTRSHASLIRKAKRSFQDLTSETLEDETKVRHCNTRGTIITSPFASTTKIGKRAVLDKRAAQEKKTTESVQSMLQTAVSFLKETRKRAPVPVGNEATPPRGKKARRLLRSVEGLRTTPAMAGSITKARGIMEGYFLKLLED